MTSAEAIEKLLKAYPGGRVIIERETATATASRLRSVGEKPRGGDPQLTVQLTVVLLCDYLEVPLAKVYGTSIEDALTEMVTMCTKMLQSRYEDCVSRIETLTSG